MKNNRQTVQRILAILVVAVFSITLAHAQEKKEEKNVMKIKMISEDGGNITLDTTIILNENFDGDWSSIIEDEELLEKLEGLDIDLFIEGEPNVYMVKAPRTHKQAYTYTVKTDDEGEVRVEVESESGGNELHEVFVQEIEGDSTISIVLKTDGCKTDSKHGEVMVWQSDDGSKKQEYKIMVTGGEDVNIEKNEGDTVITYKIRLSEEDGDDVMLWYGDDEEAVEGKVLIEKMQGDSSKFIIMTTGDDEDLKVVKKKEVIIITGDKDKKGKDKDKKKNKKKK